MFGTLWLKKEVSYYLPLWLHKTWMQTKPRKGF